MALFDPLPPCDEETPSNRAENVRKLHQAVPKAIRALEQAMTNGEYGEMIRAAQVILDRAGYGPKSVVQIEEAPDDLSDLSKEELAERAARLVRELSAKDKKSVH